MFTRSNSDFVIEKSTVCGGRSVKNQIGKSLKLRVSIQSYQPHKCAVYDLHISKITISHHSGSRGRYKMREKHLYSHKLQHTSFHLGLLPRLALVLRTLVSRCILTRGACIAPLNFLALWTINLIWNNSSFFDSTSGFIRSCASLRGGELELFMIIDKF